MKKLKSKLRFIIALSALLIITLNTMAFADTELYDLDVTPPWGRLKIDGATSVNNVNYVERSEIEVEIYAADDKCMDEEIQYYISTTAISDAEEVSESAWKNYTPGVKEKITLPSITSTNTIYAVFRDLNGNTSLIYSGANVQYTIAYDANGGSEAPEGVGVAYYGMPYIVTNQTPKREGYYFWGWSTSSTATIPSYTQGEIIPAVAFVGSGGGTVTLYAVWTTQMGSLPNLADVVEVGDYVNYPVYYDNVISYSSYKSTYNGWRVISKDIDLDGNESIGTVNLVSAGVPMTFQNASGSSSAITALTTNFLTTAFATTGSWTYRKTGFSPYQTLTETFTNKYTATKSDGVTPQVRAMVQEDIFRVTGHTSMATGTTMKLSDAKYQNLFANGAYYYLASAYSSSNLWGVSNDGHVYGSSSSEIGVRPVVSLKSNVKATGTDMIGAWDINIAE